MRLGAWMSSDFAFPKLVFLFLLIALTFDKVTCNEHGHGETTEQPETTTKCIVCDSFKEVNCSKDATIESKFEEKCHMGYNWCYKGEGNITRKGSSGHPEHHRKVHRGCTKMRQRSDECYRVRQDDGTDFKICFCPGNLCNKNLDVESFSWKDISAGLRVTAQVWGLSSLLSCIVTARIFCQ